MAKRIKLTPAERSSAKRMLFNAPKSNLIAMVVSPKSLTQKRIRYWDKFTKKQLAEKIWNGMSEFRKERYYTTKLAIARTKG